MVFFPRGVQSVHPDVVIGCVRCWCCKKNIYDGLCTVLSAKDEFLNFIDIICSLENSLGICIYTIYSDDNSWYGLWWFVFPESAKHEFYHSLENSLGTCTFWYGLWWFVYCPDAWASKRGVGLSPPFLSLTQLCWPNLHTSLNIYFPYIYFPYICVSLYVFPIYIFPIYFPYIYVSLTHLCWPNLHPLKHN